MKKDDIVSWIAATHREVRTSAATRSAILRRRFDHPIDHVWQAFSSREKLALWFGDVSGNLELNAEQECNVSAPEKVVTRVLRCEPPHLLTVTWWYRAFPRADEDEVEVRLTADGAATLLELEHRSRDARPFWTGVGPGWEGWLRRLELGLANQPSADLDLVPIEEASAERWTAVPDPSTFVRVTRSFRSEPARVFDAWLDEAMIQSFMFGPALRDEQILGIAIDARVGGRFSFKVRRGEHDIDHVGCYRVIDRPRRLVFTWGVVGDSVDESVVTVEIAPTPSGSELTLTHQMLARWADYKDRTQGGWTRMLDALARAQDR